MTAEARKAEEMSPVAATCAEATVSTMRGDCAAEVMMLLLEADGGCGCSCCFWGGAFAHRPVVVSRHRRALESQAQFLNEKANNLVTKYFLFYIFFFLNQKEYKKNI